MWKICCCIVVVSNIWLFAQVDENLTKELKTHVYKLAEEIGERNPYKYKQLQQAADYIDSKVDRSFEKHHQTYQVDERSYVNLAFEKKGESSKSIILVGAHYDSAMATPGADDNASGVAVLIALSKMLKDYKNNHCLRFVAFTLEEPPYFRTSEMGSTRYAFKMKQAKEKIKIMICLEMLGFYSPKNIQKYPDPRLQSVYPRHANYIAVVSREPDRGITTEFHTALKKHNTFSTQLLIAPPQLPGVDFSDHLSFWRCNYPALMITDTSFYRNEHYHRATDTAGTLNYNRMASLTKALAKAIRDIDGNKEK